MGLDQPALEKLAVDAGIQVANFNSPVQIILSGSAAGIARADELAKAAGVGDQVIAITEAAMRGELDFKQSFARRLALLKGLDESVLIGIAEGLRLTEGCEHLIGSLKKLGYKTAILSGGFNYFGRFIQAKLGIDYVFANELEIINGKVTGEVLGEVVDGQR